MITFALEPSSIALGCFLMLVPVLFFLVGCRKWKRLADEAVRDLDNTNKRRIEESIVRSQEMIARERNHLNEVDQLRDRQQREYMDMLRQMSVLQVTGPVPTGEAEETPVNTVKDWLSRYTLQVVSYSAGNVLCGYCNSRVVRASTLTPEPLSIVFRCEKCGLVVHQSCLVENDGKCCRYGCENR